MGKAGERSHRSAVLVPALPERAAAGRDAPASREAGSAEVSPHSGLTARVALLALAVQVGIIFWVVRSEVTARVFVSSWSLPMPGVLALLVLVGLNRARRKPWSQAQLLLVYLTLSTTVMLVGYDFIQLLIPAVATPFYYATAENRWERMLPYLPA